MENQAFEIGEINQKRQSKVVIDWGTQKVSNLSLSWEDLEASVNLGKENGTEFKSKNYLRKSHFVSTITFSSTHRKMCLSF